MNHGLLVGHGMGFQVLSLGQGQENKELKEH